MPLFLIELDIAKKLELTPEEAAKFNEIKGQANIRWLISFLNVDKHKTFNLYKAASVELVHRAVERAGIPSHAIIEVDEEVLPTRVTQALRPDSFK